MATGLIGALRITLGIDTSDFQAGTTKARAEMRGFQRDFQRMGKKWQSLGRDMTQWVTLPILAAGAGVLKMAGDFESSMIKVGISTNATTKEMATMRQMARDIGTATIFSAKEAAEGMDMLAKAGISTKDIIGGAAEAVTALAAAAGSEMEPAAAAISDAMIQFGLKAKDLPDIVNKITGAVNESKLSFEDFTMAAGQSGGVAGSAGVEFREFTAALAGTSGMFNSGSDAGTSFKTFLQRLVPDTKKARNAMKEYGFEAFDAEGKMKSLTQIAEMLQTQFGHLSEADRAGAFKTMFGQDAIRTAIGLMKLGGEGMEAMMGKIAQTNAADQAAARMKGFNAEMEKFKGALENLSIAIGDSGFLESVTGLVQGLANFIDRLSKTNPEMLKWATIIAGVAAAFGPLALVFGTFFRAVSIALPFLMKLGPVFTVLTTAMGYLIPVITAVSRALLLMLLNPVVLGAAVLITGIYLAWKNWDKIGPIVQRMYSAVKTWVLDKLGAVWAGVKAKIDAVKDWFAGLYDAVVGNSYVPDMVDEIGQHMRRLQGEMVDPVKRSTEAAKEMFRSMRSEVHSILDRLYPEQAKENRMLAEIKVLEEWMKKLGFTAAQTENAVARLRASYADTSPEANEKVLLGIGPAEDVTGPPVLEEDDGKWDEWEEGARDANGNILEDTKRTTEEMAQQWADMATGAIETMRGMVKAFKSGDILGGIQEMLRLVTQVIEIIGMIKGIGGGGSSGGGSAPGYSTGGSFKVGGSGGVDSQLVRFRATPGEQVDVRRGDQMNPRRSNVHFDLRGAVLTQDLLDQMNQMSESAAQRGAVGGASMAARNQQRSRRSALR